MHTLYRPFFFITADINGRYHVRVLILTGAWKKKRQQHTWLTLQYHVQNTPRKFFEIFLFCGKLTQYLNFYQRKKNFFKKIKLDFFTCIRSHHAMVTCIASMTLKMLTKSVVSWMLWWLDIGRFFLYRPISIYNGRYKVSGRFKVTHAYGTCTCAHDDSSNFCSIQSQLTSDASLKTVLN